MKKTLKTILIAIIGLLIGYAITTTILKLNQPVVEQTDPYEAKIQAIMQEQSFQAMMKIYAEREMLDREDKIREKRKEELRKAELELASTSKQSLKE